MIFTLAPFNELSFSKEITADCLSNKVLPKKVPNPSPALLFDNLDLDLIYGSPRASIISSGKPRPSSSIKIYKLILSLIIDIRIFWFANFTAFPIKFLKP